MADDNPALTAPASQSLGLQQELVTSRSLYKSRSNGLDPLDSLDNATQQSELSPDETSTSSSREKDRYQVGWRFLVRNFTPSWFSVTMGTGIVSLLFITIPFKATWLYWLSVVFFILNTILFIMAFVMSFLRYTLYPEIWSVMIADPNNSLFLGTIPMGFAMLVECWVLLCCPYWGEWATFVAWGAWMIDAIVALMITTGLSYILISQSEIKSLERITAAQLLPVAATIVAAGTGAEVAGVLRDPDQAIATLLVSYVLWGMATPLAMTILVIYYSRLVLHKLPPREVIVSSFLPLGPLGMGGYTILFLGKVTREVLPKVELLAHVSIAGDIVYILGIFLALIMWGFGLTWLILALLTIYSSGTFPFNMGWWGFTFPLGVFAISTISFGVEFSSLFFKVLGTILSIAVMVLWCVVAAGTARGAWSGKLFYAPCLKNLPKHQQIDSKLASAKAADNGRKA
ncbi:MAG: hypothetical protein GOMPHAMPRED_002267 [Gomphillus americanus]|uniref:Sulfite efflux pump SSU1 n=1 Tax=Gomphillus americanus TaxID=1940652 RepID=A0A8H3FBC7_9LECA|nr:MAG: hypothetical protein GOMPHAMPRED_002267 [Gomphillus americanus]